MDIAMNQFETPNRRFTILDAPGHKDFVPQMISGAAQATFFQLTLLQADVAVLVVDASPNEFESGFESGGQTKEHTLLIRSLGVQQLIVAVNKLDMVKLAKGLTKNQTEWSQRRYEEIKSHLDPFLHQAGFHKKNIFYIPCSGLTGENLKKRSENEAFSWYNGPTIVEQIGSYQ